ncbi:MAG: hypothetical protein AB1489_05865 [Acidobacteriota bacterium]
MGTKLGQAVGDHWRQLPIANAGSVLLNNFAIVECDCDHTSNLTSLGRCYLQQCTAALLFLWL